MEDLRVAVIGTGALGGFYGGLLAKCHADVHFLLRSDYEHVKKNGLRIDSKLGDFHLPKVNAYRSVQDMPACDLTILATKTTQNDQLEALLPPVTGSSGRVLVLQNGLCPEADVAAIVGEERVMGGVCFLCSNKVGPGHIHHLDYGRIVMGQHRAADNPERTVPAHVEAVANLLSSSGIDVQCCEDQWFARWKKLMWNIPFNGLSVVLNAKSDALVQDPASAQLAVALMKEIQSSASACGREIPDSAIDEMMENTRKMVPYDSSMRLDFLAGRKMEVASIFAAPVAAARQSGFEPHRVAMLTEQLEFLDRNR